MATVGWATTLVAALGSVALMLNFILDQVPTLAAKAGEALEAIRRLRSTWYQANSDTEASSSPTELPKEDQERP